MDRAMKGLLVIVAALLAANLLNTSHDSAEAQPLGTLAKGPAHGACVGIIAENGVVLRAFADGTVDGYRLGTGQADWKPITAITLPPEKK